MYAVLEDRSDQPPADDPQPPQLSRTEVQLDTAQQLSVAMEGLLVDHEGPCEEGEAAPGEEMHFFTSRSTSDILRNSVELLGKFMSDWLCFNEGEFERKRLTSLVLADFKEGGKWQAYAELIQ